MLGISRNDLLYADISWVLAVEVIMVDIHFTCDACCNGWCCGVAVLNYQMPLFCWTKISKHRVLSLYFNVFNALVYISIGFW